MPTTRPPASTVSTSGPRAAGGPGGELSALGGSRAACVRSRSSTSSPISDAGSCTPAETRSSVGGVMVMSLFLQGRVEGGATLLGTNVFGAPIGDRVGNEREEADEAPYAGGGPERRR